MVDKYQKSAQVSNDVVSLQAWRAFSLGFWNEPDFSLPESQQRRLFQNGFFRSRGSLYRLDEPEEHHYLSDYQAMQLNAANANYQTVVNDWVLFSHVMGNYCHTPRVFCIVTAEEVHWASTPWWREAGHANERLVVHPMHPDAAVPYELLTLEEDHYHGARGSGHVDDLVRYLQRQAREEEASYALTEHVEQGAFATRLFEKSLNLLNVLLVREQKEWKPHIASVSLQIGRTNSDGNIALSLETGALSAEIDPLTGTIVSCKGINDEKRLESFTHHPQSHEPIVGLTVPGWAIMREQLKDFFDESSYLRICNISCVLAEDGISFFDINENLLANHQVHTPLLNDPIVCSHVKRLES